MGFDGTTGFHGQFAESWMRVTVCYSFSVLVSCSWSCRCFWLDCSSQGSCC